MKKHSDYIAIVDYQLSNMFSVKHVFDYLHVPAIITSNPQEVLAAKAAVLPGVGAFGDAMINLKKLKLDRALIELVGKGKPLLGVCLGLQLLFSESFEFGQHQGLNLIAGKVVKFPPYNSRHQKVLIPQIGWNTIVKPRTRGWSKTPLKGLKNNSFMYFVHSYFVKPKEASVIASLTTYQGIKYCSSIVKNNIFATQFHPEKSGNKGIMIYKNWIDISL